MSTQKKVNTHYMMTYLQEEGKIKHRWDGCETRSQRQATKQFRVARGMMQEIC
jgi:ribosomal protein S18